MKNETITGSLVLVNPKVSNDPAGKQGQVGVLTYARAVDENYVKFPNGAESVYGQKDLMMLKEKEEILQELNKNGLSMPLPDFKAMYKIMMRQDMGTPSDLFSALEIARDHPGIWNKALDTVNRTEKIELENALSR
ncbi:hypothetical protein SNE26_24155 [Mucilaginibacter sp. cycad4]|uniref:hypothetical protein n=1 Tax=Mucilaginibacter sp. cycad4 TaxID=3342096 RepID=UPI002AAC32D3|nr:hypothetical protein [Mucilaginibacter gossypii]WPU99110.1 hypothetical protein SNE26_24155 [Mucilaginibacter gossypii]